VRGEGFNIQNRLYDESRPFGEQRCFERGCQLLLELQGTPVRMPGSGTPQNGEMHPLPSIGTEGNVASSTWSKNRQAHSTRPGAKFLLLWQNPRTERERLCVLFLCAYVFTAFLARVQGTADRLFFRLWQADLTLRIDAPGVPTAYNDAAMSVVTDDLR
jgi:hypothetical protein